MKGALNPTAGVLVRDRRGTHTQRRRPATPEAETGGRRPRAQGRLEPEKLEEAGRNLLWSLRREHSSVPSGSQEPCPAWIPVALPCLDLRGPAPPGSQWSCPSWISVVLPLLDLSGPDPPGSQWPCPAWISVALTLLDLSGPALPGSQGSCPAWISAALSFLDLSGPALPGSQWP